MSTMMSWSVELFTFTAHTIWTCLFLSFNFSQFDATGAGTHEMIDKDLAREFKNFTYFLSLASCNKGAHVIWGFIILTLLWVQVNNFVIVSVRALFVLDQGLIVEIIVEVNSL